ncbi:MAG: beta-glucuronidase [Lachnospiraceae bacterium]|nr:beta-glucuronidase [Lachnospiraceae bacterium]
MLYPKMNQARTLMDLSGVWEFKLDNGHGFEEKWMEVPFKSAETMAVPASYNDQKVSAAFRDHYGWAFYQKKVRIPKILRSQRIMLRFGAVTQHARVYWNGALLCEHKGGFLPFEAELREFREEGENLLCVAVDNRIDFSTLPVGNESSQAMFGSEMPDFESVRNTELAPQNYPNFDFFNYAGIHRPVKIYTTPRAYIEDITLVPRIEGKNARVEYEVCCGKEENAGGENDVCRGKEENAGGVYEACRGKEANAGADAGVRIAILDEDGQEVASQTGAKGSVLIENVRLWEPGNGYLYRARIGYGEDQYEESFGVRSVEVKGNQFYINGKPFYFKGAGKHEDSAVHGRGMDEVLNVKDISLLKWMGANSFRTSHYPYAEEMLALCDREGIVVIDETPAVGLNFPNIEEDWYRDLSRTRGHHEAVIRDLIQRDKNHACVVLWSLANEPDTAARPKSAYDYFMPLYELAHRCDPQDRPVTLVVCNNNYTEDKVAPAMDVICMNRYYGWYIFPGNLDAAKQALTCEMEYWKTKNKPVLITEYGADTVAGLHDASANMFTEEYQAAYYDVTNRILDQYEFVRGEHPWNFADFATIQGVMRVDGNKKGIFTRDRRPKLAAHYFRKRWNEIPDYDYKQKDQG